MLPLIQFTFAIVILLRQRVEIFAAVLISIGNYMAVKVAIIHKTRVRLACIRAVNTRLLHLPRHIIRARPLYAVDDLAIPTVLLTNVVPIDITALNGWSGRLLSILVGGTLNKRVRHNVTEERVFDSTPAVVCEVSWQITFLMVDAGRARTFQRFTNLGNPSNVFQFLFWCGTEYPANFVRHLLPLSELA